MPSTSSAALSMQAQRLHAAASLPAKSPAGARVTEGVTSKKSVVAKLGRARVRQVTCKRQLAVQMAAVSTVPEPETETTEFDFGGYMLTKAKEVEIALAESVPNKRPEYLTNIHESMNYSLLAGGKRVRPILCIAACELVGGSTEQAMPTACSLEMLHTMSLVHDDLPCMDNDDYRRGVLTNHKVYGETVALLAGDALMTRAFEIIPEKTRGLVEADRILDVVEYIGKQVGSVGLVGGQVVDIEMEGNKLKLDSVQDKLDTLEFIHTHKTAVLLDAAVVSGAMLGGATDVDIERMSRYAMKIGLAFQVIDDILDCTQSSEELGKTAGKDVYAGKATYPSLIGLDKSREYAQSLIAEAKAELEPYPAELAAPLLGLADYIAYRKN